MSLVTTLKSLKKEYHQGEPAVSRMARAEAAQAADFADTVPLYLQDLNQRAERLGMGVEDLRARDQELLANSQFPSALCLKADEVFLAASCQLDEERLKHLEGCSYCQAVYHSCLPDEQNLQNARRGMAIVRNELSHDRGEQAKVTAVAEAVVELHR
jgi:hypothetical protein